MIDGRQDGEGLFAGKEDVLWMAHGGLENGRKAKFYRPRPFGVEIMKVFGK